MSRRLAALTGTLSGMGPATHPRLDENRDVPVRMRDGVELLTDLYHPVGASGLPVLLMRTPYGRRAVGGLLEQAWAQRGFQVVSQSCRGTFGSGGELLPFQTDHDDGLDTLHWIAEQPWYHGDVVMYGLSYPGYAQWALAADAPAGMLRALVIQNAASQVHGVFRPHGAVALSTAVNWTYLVARNTSVVAGMMAAATRGRRVRRAVAHLPETGADTVATGRTFPFYQQILHSPHHDDPLWRPTDHSTTVGRVDVPIHLIGGWYDFFLDGQLADYAALVAAGRSPHLTIGPWPHLPSTLEHYRFGFRAALDWFRAALAGERSRDKPVRVRLMGSDEWLDLDAWPPPARERQLHLDGPDRLSAAPPTTAPPSGYRYDPVDPTPGAGGALMYDAGPVDNREREARPDVLTFTTEPLEADLDVVGVPRVHLWFATTGALCDVVVRLCDVDGSGRSINITDGLLRLQHRGSDGPRLVDVEFSATAHRFARRHRIRLQVSSGAHPRYGRCLGVADPAAGPADVEACRQQVFHDAAHLSAVLLPVLDPNHGSGPRRDMTRPPVPKQ